VGFHDALLVGWDRAFWQALFRRDVDPFHHRAMSWGSVSGRVWGLVTLRRLRGILRCFFVGRNVGDFGFLDWDFGGDLLDDRGRFDGFGQLICDFDGRFSGDGFGRFDCFDGCFRCFCCFGLF